MAQQLKLPDGRNMDYMIWGAENGTPLVWHHGTPGATTPLPHFPTICKKRGVKLITFARAGYGGSTRNKGRRIVNVVDDVQCLLLHLGISEYFVGGWSGGGPHALACAARLPGCIAAVCVAGVGPYGAEDLDFMAGQGEDNIEEFKACLQGEEVLRALCEAQRPEMLKADPATLVEVLSSAAAVDKEALLNTKFDMGQYIVDSAREGLGSSSDGWIDDDLAFFEPWGFTVTEIEVPVILYQGAEDTMVPFGHGEWLAKHLPQERLEKHLLPEEGHMSIFSTQTETMIDSLLATL